ncbi:polysaccharide deacetylase family protein [Nonomuraea africana]|uniref:Peptidoglycan/xylan/chitin deacetylase (PgdA/CDA1 family) n=1 Tax=Nonomuraea africana TaxID=46171 RepID=A0ABR9KLK5_9ACTN|nr:polysaccharide deacetylase family protein [Nonomuraea africana]MBE1562899.1 peptidoglycan/xylan/chitin deacetylase (PgdA/CDA1 family) [Nonomuraea africana]
MRVWPGLLALLLAAGCGAHEVAKGPVAVPLSARVPVRVESDVLARSLAAAQPGWPRPVERVDCTYAKCVALTFDDGPGDYTRWLLDLLDEREVRATFFVVGQRVAADKEHNLARMVEEGHELGNHSWSHAQLTTLPIEGIRRELLRTQDLVERVAGVRMRVMRPPFGSTGKRVAEETRREQLAQILWNVDTFDWRDRVASVVAKRAVRATRGSIVLLHDIHRTTVEAVPDVIDVLAKRGYKFVTVSELYGRTPDPGRKYTER